MPVVQTVSSCRNAVQPSLELNWAIKSPHSVAAHLQGWGVNLFYCVLKSMLMDGDKLSV